MLCKNKKPKQKTKMKSTLSISNCHFEFAFLFLNAQSCLASDFSINHFVIRFSQSYYQIVQNLMHFQLIYDLNIFIVKNVYVLEKEKEEDKKICVT